ncbi:elongator complex protein-like protein 1 [Sphaerosporella brunnea]|uniref:Elongator complex protein 1 n=1 Tax=Sphaerosporella brunnea TaxID=1250544 RepID=A0A5J5EZ25_9PEZI|nr:elongator complex protein-like protein 1 [Sphaerosporella brunnea]
MRNLLKTRQSEVGVDSTTAPDAPITASTWDVSTDTLICAFGPSQDGVVELTRVTQTGESTLITEWEALPEDDSPTAADQIVSLRYLPDTSSICVLFASGNIVLVREDPVVEVEILGCIDSGISAAAWSPDEEVLAITTKAPGLLLMTREFEPIIEVPFTSEDLKASQHVSVGWGKAETQFQGKHAKAQGLRDPTVPEKIDSGKLSDQDDGQITITWRGDGAYLAVSVVENHERRVIRVYSREGQLDSASEPVDGLESPITWRPVGNLIASVQRRPDRVDIVFFERNGLRHGEFTLKTGEKTPSTQLKITSMFWNGDSTVLAICLADRLQLWSMGNYHWYLKQELILQSADNKCGFFWHPEKPLKFAITASTLVKFSSFVWNTATGPFVPPNDYGIVGVVDGDKLKLTPMRIANVPPPMSFCDADLDGTPVDIAISPSSTRIAVLRNKSADLVDWGFKPRKEPQVTRNIVQTDKAAAFRQICFVSEDVVCLLGENNAGHSILRCFTLEGPERLSQDETHELQTSICALKTAGEVGGVLCEEENGNVFRYSFSEKTAYPVCKLPAACPWIQPGTLEEQIVVFGLTENGRLYANERLLASSVTSFSVTNAHLIFTTSHHVIKFVHLTSDVHDLEVPSDDAAGDERCRNIERGSRLVCVMPSKFSLVLQMPRGNLETIYPRALVLAGVRRSIEARDYKKAFLACRDNRVDLNLLHDYAPSQFLECVELFVQQLKKVEHIDLVLSQLREEDVTKTMYRETLAPTTTVPAVVGTSKTADGNKVNTICNAFIDVLRRKYLSKHMQNIITAYVCKTPPDHESALNLIATLKGKELYEQAITHICWLSDVNKLYDTALGIYDLDVAIMVAQQAQKDPREYLPFLQSLQEMEELRRRYTIDDKLGRYFKALKSLYEMGPEHFEESRSYTIQKELYTDALQLYKYEAEHLKTIMRDYASFLHSMNCFREAGFAYEYLSEHSLAIECYQTALLWRECLFLASSSNVPASSLKELAESLAESLLESKEYQNAATIYTDHLEDIPAAATALCKGAHYADAMRTVVLKNQPALLESLIDPLLREAFASTSELLAECRGQLTAQTARIAELREKNAIDPLAYFDGTTEADAPDNVSLAPTNASTSGGTLFTRYTGASLGTAQTGVSRKTSKNRRKDERKRARGKKGSVYEEEYLVNSIRRLIERVQSVHDDTQRLVEALFRRGMRESAAALQGMVKELLAMLEGCVGDVFKQQQLLSPSLLEDGILQQEEAARKVEVPVIPAFEGLSLL